MSLSKPKRNEAYGQSYRLSMVDKLGVCLSERMIHKHINLLENKAIRLLDLGCGYHARTLTTLAPRISSGTGVDIAVSAKVKEIANLTIIEKPIESSIREQKDNSFNVILAISVLEHLEDPCTVLKECHRILADNGLLLINVPTWRGKTFLEISAFKLKLSPAVEVNDHKMYYDQKDLWPLLVKAGFKPSAIKMKYHKFGLNLFSSCTKNI